MLYEAYFLNSYNKNVGSRLLINCVCYEKLYSTEQKMNDLIEKRGSYMGCMAYESEKRRRIAHRSIPIMLGSYIDYRIRGHEAVFKNRVFWGTMIIEGMLSYYMIFSTFDALSMHVRETDGIKSIEWYTYVNEEGLALKYCNKTVEWTFKQEHRNNYADQNDEDWVDLLQKANPFIKRKIFAFEYKKLWETMLSYDYNMNDLANRKFMNGAAVMSRYIDMDLAKRRRKKGVGCLRFDIAFIKSHFYSALGKKALSDIDDNKKMPQTTYNSTLHEGRSNKAAHFLPTVVRASNDAVRNSKSLAFPKDGFSYFCLLNTKDLKSAGEQNILTDGVIMTEESNESQIYEFLKELVNDKNIMTESNQEKINNIKNGSCDHSLVTLVLNGFLIDCYIYWTFDVLLKIKKRYDHVTTKYYKPYIYISTKSGIPIKYSNEYDVFFSPAESTEYNIQYPERSLISLTAQELDPMGLRKTPPSKATVAINNIKGSVANKIDDFHELLMKRSLGTTCYIEMTEDLMESIKNLAVLQPAGSGDINIYKKAFDKIDKKFNLTAQLDPKSQLFIPITEINAQKAMCTLANRVYDQQSLLMEYIAAVGSPPYQYKLNYESNAILTSYVQLIHGPECYKQPNIWNLKLYAAFGNWQGYGVEDGIILDKKTVNALPPIIYNACFTVDFTFNTASQTSQAVFLNVDESALSNTDSENEETLIGCLITETEVFVKNSKHCKILVGRIGTHYYYLLNFMPRINRLYSNLKVKQLCKGKVIKIVITGVHTAKIGVGTKIANSFGQKNVCSRVDDLSMFKGVTADGRIIHPQIMYSTNSIIGRMASGQIFCALTNPNVGFTEEGYMIFEEKLIIHTLHPHTNQRLFAVKVDTLTSVNGIDSQHLSNFSFALRNEKIHDKVVQVLGLHGFDIQFISESDLETSIDKNTYKKLLPHEATVAKILPYENIQDVFNMGQEINTDLEFNGTPNDFYTNSRWAEFSDDEETN